LGDSAVQEDLIGRRAAFINDARIDPRNDRTAVVEVLLTISGGDSTTIPRKYIGAWTGRLSTRFIIISNEIPRLNDDSKALAGRFVPVVFKKTFEGRENLNLSEEIAKERISILHWALDGLARLRTRGHFELPDSSGQFRQQLSRALSGVGAFVEDRCVLDPAARTRVDEIFNAYLAWCVDGGIRHPDSKEELGRRLRSLSIEKIQVREGGRRPYVYVGNYPFDIVAS
jgi:putative DNA primase/helicase